ncbi:MAG TPA: 30S ribosomal protein S6 [Dehalococcoidia bacterium]|nr:30S ribosomal protein S6 [Dehalococcoidia bacterium]
MFSRVLYSAVAKITKSKRKELFFLGDRKRNYELVMALTPVVNEAEAETIVENVTEFVSNQGGEVTESETWGIRRLSYPIKNFQEGNYVRTLLSIDASSVDELDRTLQANEEILLHMVSRI